MIRLGETPLFPIGLGTMPLSVPGRPDEQQAIRTIHAAIDAGVNLLDTADAYSDGEQRRRPGERLIAKALRDRPPTGRSSRRRPATRAPATAGSSTAGRSTCAGRARRR